MPKKISIGIPHKNLQTCSTSSKGDYFLIKIFGNAAVINSLDFNQFYHRIFLTFPKLEAFFFAQLWRSTNIANMQKILLRLLLIIHCARILQSNLSLAGAKSDEVEIISRFYNQILDTLILCP